MDKSFGEWNMVEKPAAVTVTYEGSYEKQKIEMVLAPNKNNYYYHNVVTHLESNDDIEENLLRNKFKMRLKWPSRPHTIQKLLHIISYVLDTKNLGLNLEQSRNASKCWEIVYFSKSDYIGDPISRESTSGFILNFLKCDAIKFRSWVSSLLSGC